jgi:hypothetical protein
MQRANNAQVITSVTQVFDLARKQVYTKISKIYKRTAVSEIISGVQKKRFFVTAAKHAIATSAESGNLIAFP